MKKELKERVEMYLKKAAPGFEALEVLEFQDFDKKKVAEEFLSMAESYYADAKHFHKSGDHLNALAALEYAEGWLDAGRLLGIFRKKQGL